MSSDDILDSGECDLPELREDEVRQGPLGPKIYLLALLSRLLALIFQAQLVNKLWETEHVLIFYPDMMMDSIPQESCGLSHQLPNLAVLSDKGIQLLLYRYIVICLYTAIE